MMISVTKLNLGLQDIAMKNQESIWYTSIDLYYGYCHTFDLSRIPELKYVTMGVEFRQNPEMIFKFFLHLTFRISVTQPRHAVRYHK